ncbi:MAG: hypothetical protein Q9217_005369, partial [Psora testacea]
MKATQDLSQDDPALPKSLSFHPPSAARNASNKRGLDDLFNSSSDPPLFSSDDLPASSAENYLQQRSKRQHRRAWYEEEEGAKRVCLRGGGRRPRERGPFHRNFDSGVWLGSDESLPSNEPEPDESAQGTTPVTEMSSFELDEADEEQAISLSGQSELEDVQPNLLKDKALQTIEDPGDYTGVVFPYWQPQPTDLNRFHSLQKHAAGLVALCVDQGREEVDLSDIGLQQIRTPTLRPLRYITKHTSTSTQPPDDQFQALIPNIGLYLSNNNLTDIPSEVYHLNNLHVLSLRSNNITEVLPAICNLTNLRELNLSCNQLRYLPYEILDFKDNLVGNNDRVPKFNVLPNPLMRPVPSVWPREYNEWRMLNKYVTSTRIAFFDVFGHSLRNCSPAPSSVTEHWLEPNIDAQDELYPPAEEQHIFPSLLETVLRACYNAPDLSQAPFFLPPDASPHLSKLLQRTFRLKEAGGQA